MIEHERLGAATGFVPPPPGLVAFFCCQPIAYAMGSVVPPPPGAGVWKSRQT